MKFTEMEIINMDNTLTRIIFSGLIQYQKALLESDFGGYPSDMYDLIGVKDTYNPTDKEDAEAFRMWLGILDEMIFAFDVDRNPDIMDYDVGFSFEKTGKERELDSGEKVYEMNIEVENQEGLDRYHQDMEEWQKKVKRGRELFVKYLDSIWI
jgi:hypothetical protein